MVPTQVRSVVEVDTLKTNLIYSYTTGINNKRLPLISDAGFRAQENSLNFSVFQKEIKHGELERLNVVEKIVLKPYNDKEGTRFSLYLVELMNDLN